MFSMYCSVRTFSNAAEAAITAVAMFHWKRARGPGPRLSLAFAFAALACLIRPTSGIIWVIKGSFLLWRDPRRGQIVVTVLAVG